MKNLFFALTFMLIGTLTFANNVKVETIDNNIPIENVINIENTSIKEITFDNTIEDIAFDDAMNCEFPLSWNTDEGSGSFYFGCDNNTTIDDILFIIFALFW